MSIHKNTASSPYFTSFKTADGKKIWKNGKIHLKTVATALQLITKSCYSTTTYNKETYFFRSPT